MHKKRFSQLLNKSMGERHTHTHTHKEREREISRKQVEVAKAVNPTLIHGSEFRTHAKTTQVEVSADFEEDVKKNKMEKS